MQGWGWGVARSATGTGGAPDQDSRPSPTASAVAYSPEQRRIIGYRGGHIQVTACAGSGKTETVSMRVATLIQGGAEPGSIIAFTFTNAAAASLKTRIISKVQQVLPGYNLDRLSPLFVGTIHAFCLRLLQERVPRYAAFDLFEEHRLVGLLSREYFSLGLDCLGVKNRIEAIGRFIDTASVIENEMFDTEALPEGDFRNIYVKYLDLLHRYHVLTHNQCIYRAVKEVEKAGAGGVFLPKLRHLIVDEFQDINPAQARLIDLLGKPPVHVCVVGDDDQAIYQWRGSSVEFIQRFQQRFQAETETLGVNRRSRAKIVALAAGFAKSLPKRLPKEIKAKRDADEHEVKTFVAPTAEQEAERIADAIRKMNDAGIAYRDIAVLLRSVRTSGPALLSAFEQRGIRYKCSGRTGLFLQPEAELLGRIYAYVGGRTDFWNARNHAPDPVDLDTLLPLIRGVFHIDESKLPALREHLETWRKALPNAREADLVGSLYRLLRRLGVQNWNPDDPDQLHRLGVLARFSEMLADFESVTRRARRVQDEESGEEGMRGGLSGGQRFVERLVNYIGFYAQTEYDDFAGEPDFDLDGVTITTIHQSKGLEWPVVFLPCLSAGRFPSRLTGSTRSWLIPREKFPASRYEGSDEDERRLFYVAMTRARDHLYLSTHERVTTKRIAPSPYFSEVAGAVPVSDEPLWTPTSLPTRPTGEDDKPTFTFSELAAYQTCPLSFRLRNNLGFQPTAAKEIGYGKAVHHILRRLAESVLENGSLPSQADVDAIFDAEFYLPYADRPAFDNMRARAGDLVSQYLTDFPADLKRVWEVERSFELHLPEANIAGRADVILDREGGQLGALALVDYKTKTAAHLEPNHQLQLAIYTAAARGEGFDVRAAYLHDLASPQISARKSVPTGEPQVNAAKLQASDLAKGIRSRRYSANVGDHCRTCDVRFVCPHGPEDHASGEDVNVWEHEHQGSTAMASKSKPTKAATPAPTAPDGESSSSGKSAPVDPAQLLEAIQHASSQYYRLVILAGVPGSGKTAALQSVAQRLGCQLVNVNLELSRRMLELTRMQRSRQVERLLRETLAAVPGDVALLDNLEILFDTALEVEPLRLLHVLSRNRTIVASWSGAFRDGTLNYAEPGHPEFMQIKETEAVVLALGTSENNVRESTSS